MNEFKVDDLVKVKPDVDVKNWFNLDPECCYCVSKVIDNGISFIGSDYIWNSHYFFLLSRPEGVFDLEKKSNLTLDKLVKSYVPLENIESKKSALDVQEGGGHYKSKGIQPVEYAYRNNLGFIESNVVKYVSRWKEKNGIQDLKKARHYLDILIEFEEQKEEK